LPNFRLPFLPLPFLPFTGIAPVCVSQTNQATQQALGSRPACDPSHLCTQRFDLHH